MMKKYSECIVLFMAFLLAGCSSTLKKDEFVGVWINEKENSKIQFNKDFTFSSTNLPLDVANKQFVTLDKQTKGWQGVWSVEGNQIKLTSNDYYYYLDVTPSFFSSKLQLYVTLLDESGGEMIYFDKEIK